MSNRFLRDADEQPDLFALSLPVPDEEIDDLERRLECALPPSFREVLHVLGQGSFFDNETLLGVHEVEEGIGTLEEVNRELRDKQKLDPSLVVFHVGTGGLHAFDVQSMGPEYSVVQLDEETLDRGEVYDSFEAWYVERIRAEYRDVLGLE